MKNNYVGGNMEQLVIKGGNKLKGEVRICGAKNSAVALMCATILFDGNTTIKNLPQISDTKLLSEILSEMGAEVSLDGDIMKINNDKIKHGTNDEQKAGKFRASYYLAGALLGKYREANIPLPGGCNLGTRPIDLHIKGFEKLGAKVTISHGMLNIKARALKGAKIYLDTVSVGASINIMLAASMAKGTTTIENAAKEPHVVDVANMLNKEPTQRKNAEEFLNMENENMNIPVMSVSGVVKQLSDLYGNAIKAGVPLKTLPTPFFWGAAGVGKSDGVKQLAEELHKKTGKKINVTDVRLLLFSPVDLRGVPVADEHRRFTNWLRPTIFNMDGGDDTVNILFLDELSAAPQSVQAAAYQICLDRTVGEHKLPDNCIVIAAGNRTTDQSIAYKMPKALCNRLMHFRIQTDSQIIF